MRAPLLISSVLAMLHASCGHADKETGDSDPAVVGGVERAPVWVVGGMMLPVYRDPAKREPMGPDAALAGPLPFGPGMGDPQGEVLPQMPGAPGADAGALLEPMQQSPYDPALKPAGAAQPSPPDGSGSAEGEAVPAPQSGEPPAEAGQ